MVAVYEQFKRQAKIFFFRRARKVSSILFIVFSLVFLAFGGFALGFGFFNKEFIEPFIVGAAAIIFAVCSFVFARLPSIKWLIKISSVTKSGIITQSRIQNYSCDARKSHSKHGIGDIWYHVKFDYCFINSNGQKIDSKFKRAFRKSPNLYNGKSLRVLYNEKYSVVLD